MSPANPKPAPRKKRKPRYRTPRCIVRRCKRRQIVLTFCRTHARLECDRKLSTEVRQGECEFGLSESTDDPPVVGPVVACSGAIQCAHGFSRRYLGTRWLRLNVFALCAAHHFWFGLHPIEWNDFLLERWGDAAYAELRRLALSSDGPPDYQKVLESLA